MHLRSLTLACGLSLAIFLPLNVANASLTFTSSPTAQVSSLAVKAEATFGEIGTTGNWDGTLLLKNDLATPSKAQLLTGVLFSIDNANPVLTLTSAGLGTGSVLVLDSTGSTSSTAIDLIGNNSTKKGRYQFKGTPGGSIGTGGFAQEYGVSTIGGGSLGGPFQGNVVGNDDYAIMGAGTNVALSTFGGQFPYVRDSVLFNFGGLGTAGVSLSHVTGVTFLYGSLPDGFVPGFPPAVSTPEPASIATAVLGSVFGLTFLRKRRKPLAA